MSGIFSLVSIDLESSYHEKYIDAISYDRSILEPMLAQRQEQYKDVPVTFAIEENTIVKSLICFRSRGANFFKKHVSQMQLYGKTVTVTSSSFLTSNGFLTENYDLEAQATAAEEQATASEEQATAAEEQATASEEQAVVEKNRNPLSLDDDDVQNEVVEVAPHPDDSFDVFAVYKTDSYVGPFYGFTSIGGNGCDHCLINLNNISYEIAAKVFGSRISSVPIQFDTLYEESIINA
jgi:hypothetical protein